jgi:hypothetical protein
MKTAHKKSWQALLALIVLLGATLACYIDAQETAVGKLDKEFEIDSSTILIALSQGQNDVFFERKVAPATEIASRSEAPVNWNQADYFRVADALHQFIWNEPLDSMNPFWMYFNLSCSETEHGLQYANLLFFRTVETDRGKVRIKRGMEIDPRNNSIAVWETEYYPVLGKWKPIDLSKVEISADEVLQIAENSGGREKRMAVDNECYIVIVMSTDTIHYQGWTIDYSKADNSDVFYEEIDPVTGKQH